MRKLLIALVALFVSLALTGCPDNQTPCPTCGPTCVPTATVIPPTATPSSVLWDGRLTQLGVGLHEIDCATVPECWKVKAAWITVSGSWDDVPAFAKQWQQDTLGGDHHVFGRAEYSNGDVAKGAGFYLLWDGGYDMRTPEADGWANLPIFAGYDWAQGSGGYSFQKVNGDILTGIGLPYTLPWESSGASAMGGVHISVFSVWELAND